MEQKPGPSRYPVVKKNPPGKYVLSDQKKIIIHIYKQIKRDLPEMKYRDIIKTISNESGVGHVTITKTISEYKKTGRVSSPNQKRKRATVVDKLSEQEKSAIRQKVHEFWYRWEIPNLPKVLSAINADNTHGMFSRTSLHRVLKALNFEFTTRHNKSALLESNDIVVWRHKYLTSLAKYKKEGRPIYYLDETWVDAGDCRKKQCTVQSIASTKNTRQQRLSTNIPEPTGDGKSLIVLHIGSVDGFVPGGLLYVESAKNTADYQDENNDDMNGEKFFEWFKNILPSLKEGAVVVMDNAPHHCEEVELYPTMNWTKARIVDWLTSKGEEIPSAAGKAVLLEKVQSIKQQFNKYKIDEYAKQNNKIVLRLPPCHCELNPMELAFAIVKDYVKSKNTSCKIEDVKNLVVEGINRVSTDMWQIFFYRTGKEEAKLAQVDHLSDELIDSEILNPASGTVSETDTESSDSDF